MERRGPARLVTWGRRLASAAASLLLALGALSQETASVSFHPPDGGPQQVRTIEPEHGPLFSVNDVVAALGGATAFDAPTRSFELHLGGHTVVFGTESPIAVVDTRLVSVASPVTVQGQAAFADLPFLQKVLGPPLSLAFAWDAAARTLTASRAVVSEVSVEVSVAAFETTTKVVLRFSQPPSYRVEKGEGQIVIRFPGARLVPNVPERVVDDPRVTRVVARGAEVAVFLKEKGLPSNVYPLSAPPRLVIDVSGPVAPLLGVTSTASPTSGTSAMSATSPSAAPGAAPVPTPARPKTVVLDAGHGGSEEGARGAAGLLEKEATLELVRSVREVLVKKGYTVVTTRDSDVSVALDERAAAANAAKADVFLSLHCNASRKEKAHGTEVYYLSLDASDRAAAALAELENRPVATTGTADPAGTTPTASAETNAALRELDLILWDLAQNQHLAASARLAEQIQADFDRLLGIPSRGVKQAPFKVLIGVNAPAVLVEVAFITNPDEERLLASEEFRRQAAETLAGSLEAFFKTGDSVPPVPVPGASAP